MNRKLEVTLAFTALAALGAVCVFIIYRAIEIDEERTAKKRADDFSCGYSYGTKDSVIHVNPALAARPEFQLPKYCAELAEMARKNGVVRIVPWQLRGPVQ